MKFERYHIRHYFGGVGVILLILQILSGIFLTLYYTPHLKEAYASVQYLYNGFSIGAWIRDSHRWIAFSLFFVIILHSIRSLLRMEFRYAERRINWLTGVLLVLPLLMLLVTGIILPWEWKGYWFMEMVPNYLGHIPFVGAALKEFLIEAFTMSRNFIAHVLILPLVVIILIEYHILASLRKRKGGILGYIKIHAILAIPFVIMVAFLATTIPMPTEDPNIIPMPLEGEFIPTPEWFALVFYVPFIYFKNQIAPLLGLYLPLILFLALALLPFYFGKWKGAISQEISGGTVERFIPNNFLKHLWEHKKLVSFFTVLTVASILFGSLYSVTYRSPTLGCNSCHNTMNGVRMGIPPEAFKNRNVLPLLSDSQWMSEHWFVPQLVW